MKKISLLLALLCAFAGTQVQAAQCKFDLLDLEQIRTIKPSTGLNAASRELLELAGNMLITAPITAPFGSAVREAGKGVAVLVASKGVEKGVDLALNDAVEFDYFVNQAIAAADTYLSEQDDLIVRINGRKIVPQLGNIARHLPGADLENYGQSTGDYQPMVGGSTVEPKTGSLIGSFFGSAHLQLIEHDTGSPNDDLGSVEISDELFTLLAGSLIDPVNSDTHFLFYSSEGSQYEYTYTVYPDQGNRNEIPERLVCNSETCVDAREPFPRGYKIDIDSPGSCPDAYRDAGKTDQGRYRVCELQLPLLCDGSDFTGLNEYGGISALKDGDVIVLRSKTPTHTESLDYRSNSTGNGQYLARCDDCFPESIIPTNADAHIIDPDRSAARWTVKVFPDGKIGLRADNGKYLTRCIDCVPGFPPGMGDLELASLIISDPDSPHVPLTIKVSPDPHDDYRYTIQADDGTYLAPCFNCIDGDSRIGGEDSVLFRLTDGAEFFAAWSIEVRANSRIDPKIYTQTIDGTSTLNHNRTVTPTETWVIEPGETLEISSGKTLTVKDGGEIENKGTIIIKGTLRVGQGGTVTNQGVIDNKKIIQLDDGTINNQAGGVIVNSPYIGDNYFLNYKGTLVNAGSIYDPFGKYYGENPTLNLPLDGYFLGPNTVGESTCHILGGEWEDSVDSPDTCTMHGFWLKEGKVLAIASGVTLNLEGMLANDGDIVNDGNINNEIGSIRDCGTFDPYGSAGQGVISNLPLPCVRSEVEKECEDVYGGQFNETASPQVCEVDDAVVDELSILTIGSGIRWIGRFENLGTINIEEYGEFFVRGGATNRSTIHNYGLITVGFNYSLGIPYNFDNEYEIYNFGTIDNHGNIVGDGRISNRCGAVVNVLHCESFEGCENPYSTPYDPEGEFHIIEHEESFCPRSVDDDSDDDGVVDISDAFPFDATETTDSDGDGVGDNADAFPNDPTETRDSDSDGIGNSSDLFPFDPTESDDYDGDGVGDNSDKYPKAVTKGVSEDITVTTAPASSDSSCSLGTVTAAPVTALIPSEIEAVTSQVSFTLSGCESAGPAESVIVSIDFGEELPAGARAYKVASTEGWKPISGVNVTGSVLTYTVVDNGELDENEAIGEIDDPVAMVLLSIKPVPAVSALGISILAALLGIIGLRRRIK